MEAFEELQSVVRRLQKTEEGIHPRRAEAAAEVRRLAKDSPDFQHSLALLGAIPPLVALLDTDDSDSLISSLYALLNLRIGNEANKSAIVAAGAIQKMVSLIKSGLTLEAEAAIIANFLGLSALDGNKPIIAASSDVIPFLLNASRSSNSISSTQSQEDALRALYDLSISPVNGVALINAGIVPCLLSAVVDDTEFTAGVWPVMPIGCSLQRLMISNLELCFLARILLNFRTLRLLSIMLLLYSKYI